MLEMPDPSPCSTMAGRSGSRTSRSGRSELRSAMPSSKSTAILGISALYHDSAAALLIDGELVAAAQEERFTRRKHDAGYPEHAIRYCLSESGLTPQDLAYV